MPLLPSRVALVNETDPWLEVAQDARLTAGLQTHHLSRAKTEKYEIVCCVAKNCRTCMEGGIYSMMMCKDLYLKDLKIKI